MIKKDLDKVSDIITKKTSFSPIASLQKNILSNGKKIRPKILLLIAHSLGYKKTNVHKLAAAIELIHISSLIHDDIIDESKTRRGEKSAFISSGVKKAILSGDILSSIAFGLVSETNEQSLWKLTSDTVSEICLGEIIQLEKKHELITKEKYISIIKQKTAKLFKTTAEFASYHNGNKTQKKAATDFAYNFGIAFQIKNDCDNFLNNENQFSDLRLGYTTLPIINLYKSMGKENILELKKNKKKLLSIMHKEKVFEKAQKTINYYINKANTALNELPDNKYTKELSLLTKRIFEK